MTIEQLPQPGVRVGGCGCGEHDLPEPTIDATAIPHRLRHAAVLGAAQSMNAGEAFIIRACPDRCSLRSRSCPASGPLRSSLTALNSGMSAPLGSHSKREDNRGRIIVILPRHVSATVSHDGAQPGTVGNVPRRHNKWGRLPKRESAPRSYLRRMLSTPQGAHRARRRR